MAGDILDLLVLFPHGAKEPTAEGVNEVVPLELLVEEEAEALNGVVKAVEGNLEYIFSFGDDI